jgi:hypothetical protein
VLAWRYLGPAGEHMGWSGSFADAEVAEAWMTTAWEELAERGVCEVELVERDEERTLYRMSLAEPA